ncbi:MAG TPA: serine/threonine-protein kinase [Gemmataceae bacterium]
MPDENRLLELVLRWEELRDAGHNPSAAELCQDCPDLLPAFQERLQALEAMNSVLTAGDERQSSGTFSRVGSFPTITGYEIVRELGRGGMGVVYQARQAETNRFVALKMLQTDRRAMPVQKARFDAEVQALVRLQHPNVVRIMGVGNHDGHDYFVMEYLDGGNLAEKIGSQPQSPRQAAALVEILARTIHAAHERGIIHRDLKPANVLLAADGTPKIGDFGLARRNSVVARLTRSLQILGTPGYMAPEQAAGQSKRAGPASDIYALGAILYQLLTGRPPFQGDSAVELVRQAAEDEPLPLRHWQSAVPADLEAICLKCLSKQAMHRYPTAAALADDLRRFLGLGPIWTRPRSWWRRLAHWARKK